MFTMTSSPLIINSSATCRYSTVTAFVLWPCVARHIHSFIHSLNQCRKLVTFIVLFSTNNIINKIDFKKCCSKRENGK